MRTYYTVDRLLRDLLEVAYECFGRDWTLRPSLPLRWGATAPGTLSWEETLEPGTLPVERGLPVEVRIPHQGAPTVAVALDSAPWKRQVAGSINHQLERAYGLSYWDNCEPVQADAATLAATWRLWRRAPGRLCEKAPGEHRLLAELAQVGGPREGDHPVPMREASLRLVAADGVYDVRGVRFNDVRGVRLAEHTGWDRLVAVLPATEDALEGEVPIVPLP